MMKTRILAAVCAALLLGGCVEIMAAGALLTSAGAVAQDTGYSIQCNRLKRLNPGKDIQC